MFPPSDSVKLTFAPPLVVTGPPLVTALNAAGLTFSLETAGGVSPNAAMRAAPAGAAAMPVASTAATLVMRAERHVIAATVGDPRHRRAGARRGTGAHCLVE